jgi:hypothetical protein
VKIELGDHTVNFWVPSMGGTLPITIYVAPTCAQADLLRTSKPPVSIVLCRCQLVDRLLPGASPEERAEIAKATFWLAGDPERAEQ